MAKKKTAKPKAEQTGKAFALKHAANCLADIEILIKAAAGDLKSASLWLESARKAMDLAVPPRRRPAKSRRNAR